MFNVLCVDDSQNNLFTLSSILEKLKDIEITTALSAKDGFSVLIMKNIDLILLDIQMPEMDGFDMAKLIKANASTSHIPIIFLTAVFQSNEFKKRGYEIGAIEYLTKPIDDNQLLNKIKLYQKLILNEKNLRRQKDYMQKILDLQEHIIIVIDYNNLLSANKHFFDFFGFTDLEDFFQEYQCICELFMKKDGFLPPTLHKNEKPWLDTLLNEPLKMHLAMVKYLNTDTILSVKASLLDAKNKIYLITLSDVTQIHQMKEKFKHEALTDKLTGAYNRTKFDASLDNAILNASKKPFTMAILDIDHFKLVNDVYGHLTGDSVLKELVKLAEDNIRNEDLFARWGGEEFVFIFFTSIDLIRDHIEKIRLLIEKHNFTGLDGSLTVSIGLGEYDSSMSKDSFIASVDNALYRAKETGRNKIIDTRMI